MECAAILHRHDDHDGDDDLRIATILEGFFPGKTMRMMVPAMVTSKIVRISECFCPNVIMAMRMMVSMMTWRSRPSRNAPPFSNWAPRIPLDSLHILKKNLWKNQASKADRRFTKDSLTNTSRIPKIKPAKITLLVLIGHLVVIKRSGETPDRGLIMLSVWSFENILFFDDDISSTPDDNVLW